ncbi:MULTISPECIES: copper amine oxidase N-terminal domain-containing protein [unclassified Paenibacillus]|uniref:copper amine oxidase N-terminal domain-containing protein n=2 Tax=Paenibacillus TaxID=44249 RepID=UPI0009D35C6B|nr:MULTISPECIES: copper amine oxidase N-terminal domain-containing protein [unclassified Paenibacillus]SLK18423.1 Copper amine oxidase N-terminal domain-containing protein [Paenibacillus sp. RU5A]SOC75237.1 Copper amine oxidase N-terminal domain-containing protein [Paenibacillus sp. RU26A]SOC77296.1 Copper amine oxidase N-terminal domain-containing protein [Paenibacillus sp. RU5M]
MKMKMKKFIAPMLSLTLLMPGIAGAAAAPQTPMTTMKASVNTPAADLRASLDHLLSEHFALAVIAMAKAYDGAKDADAAYKALDQNALDMQPAIASLYGDAGAKEFERIFRAHNKYTDDLVKATKMGNQAGIKQAQNNINGFVEEFSTFLSTATEGKLPKAAAKNALKVHEDLVQKVFDEYVAGDYTDAYKAYREGFKEMFDVSKALSTAITTQMPEKFENSKADTPAADLRSALNHLASEHFALSALQMQEQYDGRTAASNALVTAEAGNTADFKAAIASIYGNDGANAFEKIWVTNHVNAQSDYVTAVKNNDAAARAAVEKRIDGFTTEFATFLDSATTGNLPKAAGQQALTTHEKQVQQVLDQYAAANYGGSYTTNREGFKVMFGVGQALGNAIVTQFNDKFQEQPTTPTMPETETTTVWMQVNSKTLKINDKTTNMDTTPMLWKNTTYIPLRFLSEGIGATVKWDKKAQQVTVMAGNDTLKFWVNNNVMEVNGMKKNVGATVFVNKDGRTQVPLRFIAELLGWDVKWAQKDGSITLTKSM